MKLSKKFIAMFREEAKKAQWEINRWNGKSIDDLVVDYLERKELKPEDFKDVVVLTVKEAKLVQGGIRLLALRSNIYLEGGLIKMLQELLDNVDKQIEQTKNYDDSAYLKREIDQLKKDQTKDDWLKNQFLETVVQEKERKSNELY